MEQAVENLEKQVHTTHNSSPLYKLQIFQMNKADEKLDSLALQVGNIENNIFSEDGTEVEVFTLLQSVNDVKTNYQSLRKEILEVQDLQKELSSSLQTQLKIMQDKCNLLKEKISVNVPQSTTSVPKLSKDDAF